MKKIIILVFLYVIFAYATGMSIDNGELAINAPSEKVTKEKITKEKTAEVTKRSIGEVDFRLGELTVKHNGSKQNEDCDEEDKIFELDTLTTGEESKCEIILNDGSTIRISEKSKYVFESYSDTPDIAFVGNLLQGETWTNVNRKDKSARDFKVKSPIAVAAVVGTSYRMTSDGEMTNIAVRNGQVNVDLQSDVKTKYNITPPKKSNSFAPKEVGAPKEVPGPYEVTLDEWISVVKGEVISVRYDGRYNKFKTDIEKLEQEWNEFMESKK